MAAKQLPSLSLRPASEVSLLSRAFFTYVSPLIAHGASKNKLNLADLLPNWPQDEAAQLVAADAAFCSSQPGKRASLRARLVHATRRQLCQAFCCRAVYAAAQLAFPMLLQLLVRGVASNDHGALLWAFLLTLVNFVGAVAEQQQQALAFRAGVRARSLCVALLTRKCLSLSRAALSGRDPGDVANLLANDAQRLFVFAPQVAQLWSAPLQVAVSSWLLVRLLGVGALAGVGALLALVPLLTSLARRQCSLRQQHLPLSDLRVRLVA